MGDQHVRVVVETPQDLTPKQKELLNAFAQACGEEANPHARTFFSKVKELLALKKEK